MNQRPTHMQTEAHTTHGYYLEFAKVVFIENKNVYKPIANGAPATAHVTAERCTPLLPLVHTTRRSARQRVQVPVGSGFVEIYYPHGSDIIIRGVASGTWQIHLASGKKRLLLFLLVLLEEERCALRAPR